MPTYIETHARDASVRKWNLIEIDFASPAYLATCDFNVDALSHIWYGTKGDGFSYGRPCNVKSITVQGGSLSEAQVELADADNFLIGQLRAANGGQGVLVTIYEAWFDLSNLSAVPDATRLRAEGKIDSVIKDASGGTDLVTLRLVGAGRGAKAYIPPRLLSALK